MIQSIFSQYLDDTLTSTDLYAEDMTQYSRWCNGERPIPKDIIQHYENNNLWNIMEQDFRDKIIPNLINESQARSKTDDLLDKSIDVLGKDKVQELKSISDNAFFLAEMVRYAVLNNHCQDVTYSPDLSETLLSGRVPSCTKDFIGRKKNCLKHQPP